MKIKEIDRTANIAWSPAAQHPIYLAAGTAAQQLDATFSTTASLEIYGLNLTEPGLDMSLKGCVPSDNRFHKVVWGCHGMGSGENENGVIVGGADAGHIFMYDPAKLISGETALIYKREKHTGPVASLDFNQFQTNLLASGASESEIYIWDLNNPNSPMTPGAKSQPGEDVTCVAWNRQVQHILASTFAARCVVWDLRKNEPIIKVSDSTSRMRCKVVAWHPEVATQMCLASEDDHTPVIQLWDLRFATSPLKILENHQRGVLSIAWCPQDPDLLLSCGKDNRILCWNPNSYVQGGEVVCELPTSNQWSFDVSWCPRNPAVIASSSFDGHISIHSLMGGQQQVQTSSKIVEAFPGTDPFSQAPVSQVDQRNVSMPLKKPPKWLRKPVGASFGFGGKLVSFENLKSQPQQPVQAHVYISQVTTEPLLISRSTKLENALANGQFSDFCQTKLSKCSSDEEKLWSFLLANFDSNPRLKFLSLLGYDPQDVQANIALTVQQRPQSRGQGDDAGVDAEELAKRMSILGNSSSTMRTSPSNLANISASRTPDSTPNYMGGGEGAAIFDNIANARSQDDSPDSPSLFPIPVDDDIDGLISKTLLTGNLELAVDLCLKDGRMADAVILAMTGGKELLAKTQKKYFKSSKGELSKLISAVVNDNWSPVIQSCEIDSWKEALAACLTYAKPQEFPIYCQTLGSRLENEKNGDLLKQAMLCYICAGNVEKLVECWVKTSNNPNTPEALQDLVELVMILRKAVEQQGQTAEMKAGFLAEKLTEYAALLASQGSLSTALVYLGNSDEQSISILRDRLLQAIGQLQPGIQQITAHQIPAKDNKPSAYKTQVHVQPVPHQMKSTGFSPSASSGPTAFTYTSSQFPGVGVAPTNPLVPSYPANAPPPPLVASPSTPVQQPQPPAPPPTSQTTVFTKGHLAQRYPTVPQDPSLYSQSYGQPSYLQQPSYSQPSGFPQPQTGPPAFVDYSSSPVSTSLHTTYSTTQPYPSTVYSNSQDYAAPVQSTVAPPSIAPVPPLPSMYQESWNDPPHLKASHKVRSETLSKSKQEFETPPPITRPIFSVPEPEPVVPTNYPPTGFVQPSVMGNYGMPPEPVMSQEQPSQLPLIAEPPRPKSPIPGENKILQDIFEDLKNRCVSVANNPQVKRKLEDVSKKLETLYDKLREKLLSPATILGLHQIVQAIQQCDYATALQIHAQTVASGTFSEISGFMPGLKVLLQTAMQLNVYIQ